MANANQLHCRNSPSYKQSVAGSICLLFALLTTANAEDQRAISENLRQLLQTKICVSCDLSGTDLEGLNLQGVNLNNANLAGANLTNTNLRGANLMGANLKGVILLDTLLAGADLRNADMSDLDIDIAFESIEIIGTQFEGARFKYGVVCGPAPEKGGWGCRHQ